ncbi:hypothetical protein [Haloarcula marismortui]|uniref:hypothetical protein n=1 Tax=Haloarcula marismortui TaxID=2238 RepID=UPI0012678E67|nr:hypothetical protein [Haloarcula californiae]
MLTKDLLNSIGYPKPDSPESIEPVESHTLYDHARRNKVGSLYVKSLKETSGIDELSEQWQNRQDFQNRTKQALNRLPDTIPSDIEYAVVKSGYPWVDSKDIDLVLFNERLRELEDHLLNEGYEFCGRSPTSFDVIDPVTNIQLDIQSGFSLQRIIYFDKQTVRDGVERRSPYGTSIPILEKPDDLALIVIHSITEQMYILKEFYTAVAMLESFSRNQFERFLDIVAKNRIESACRSFFTITWELCKQVFDHIPPYLREIKDQFGLSTREQDECRSNDLKMPHKYTGRTGIRTVAGKMRNSVFRRSLASQIPRLAHPSTAYYILSQIVTRREREHYVHDTSDMGGSEEA